MQQGGGDDRLGVASQEAGLIRCWAAHVNAWIGNELYALWRPLWRRLAAHSLLRRPRTNFESPHCNVAQNNPSSSYVQPG